jgi:hypothetical protein
MQSGYYVQGNFRFGAIFKDEMKIKPAIKPAPCEFPKNMPVTMTITWYLESIPRKFNTWQKALDNAAPDLESILMIVPDHNLKLVEIFESLASAIDFWRICSHFFHFISPVFIFLVSFCVRFELGINDLAGRKCGNCQEFRSSLGSFGKRYFQM